MSPLFEAIRNDVDDRTQLFGISRSGTRISFADALYLWQHDEAFRELFMTISLFKRDA